MDEFIEKYKNDDFENPKYFFVIYYYMAIVLEKTDNTIINFPEIHDKSHMAVHAEKLKVCDICDENFKQTTHYLYEIGNIVDIDNATININDLIIVMNNNKNCINEMNFYYRSGRLYTQYYLYKNFKVNVENEYYQNGNIKSKREFPPIDHIDENYRDYELSKEIIRRNPWFDIHENVFAPDTTQSSYRQTTYHENGKIKSKSIVINGDLDGIYEEWYDNEQLYKKANYKSGKLIGDYIEYHRNGKVKITEKFDNGLNIDVTNIYYDDGKPLSTQIYSSRGFIAKYEAWHRNGQLAEKTTYTTKKRFDSVKYNVLGLLTYKLDKEHEVKLTEDGKNKLYEIWFDEKQIMMKYYAKLNIMIMAMLDKK